VLASACSKPKLRDANFVLAEGKGFKITNAELDSMVQDQVFKIKSSGYEPNARQIEDIRKRNLLWAIDLKLIDFEIRRINPANLEKIVRDQIERSNRMAVGQKPESKPDPKTLDRIRQKVAIEFVLQERQKDLPIPSEPEARAIYEKNPNRWKIGEKIAGTQFLLPLAANANAATIKKAKESLTSVRGKVKAQATLDSIQQERISKKESPLLTSSSFWSRENLPLELAEQAGKIQPGEVTEVLKTPRGFVFYRLDHITPEKQTSLEEAVPRILQQMKREQVAKIRRNLFQELRQTYQVKVTEPPLSKTSAGSTSPEPTPKT